MNYLFLGRGLLYLQYAYVDLHINDKYVGDSLFCRHRVPVKFGPEAERDGVKCPYGKPKGELDPHPDYGMFRD